MAETRPTKALKLHPEAEQIPPMQADEWQAFRDDIAERGIQVPIEIAPDWTILDGRHRWRAAQELGLSDVPVRVVNPPDPIAYMAKAAILRRHLTNGQRAALAVLYLPKLEEEAKGRQGERRDLNIVEIIPQSEPPRSRDQAAEVFGVNPHYVSDAKRLQQDAPDVFEQVKAGTMTLPEAKQERKKRDRAAIQELPKPLLPAGKYRALVIDPPWPMEKIMRDVRPNQVTMDYPTMTIDEIAALPIPDLFDANGCHVYLWTTHRFLPDALRLFDAWGVRYQCMMTWVKNVGFTPYSWMYSTEHVLFGRIGSLDLTRKGLRLDFEGKVREHSRKPDIFYDLVQQASPGPRLDMFSREAREGFSQWGNESEKFNGI